MKRRLLSILLTLCLLTQLFPITASAVRLDWPHPSAHCVCGGGISNHKAMNGHTTYEGVYFTKDGTENTSGNDISKMNAIQSEEDLWAIHRKAANNQGKTFYYYLANDVTLTGQIYVWEGCTFVICLHGHTLTCNVPNAGSAFLLMNNARLVFTDCQVSGDRGLITGDSYAAVSVAKTATFELYGVSICMTSSETDGIRDIYNDPVCGVDNGGTFNMYGGCYYQKSDTYPTDRPVISNIRNTKYGPGVINRGTFNMYDGIISGNERNGVMSTIANSDDTINIYGGTITGNTGAGISATHWPMPSIAESDYYTNVNLYGGTISENTGVGIDAAYGRVTMAQQNNAIPVEIKNNKGGAISLTRDGSTANLGTGTITGNSGGKGAVALSAGSLTLTGDVKITGNTGANLYLANGKTVTLDKLGTGAQIGVTTENTAVPVVFSEANGTDYTSRFTPDSPGYSIGYNAAQQLQLQTMTYPVTYNPGANGTGDSQTVNKEYNNALELEGARFTRLGYTQVGWSKTDGGEMDYSLNAIYEQNEALTLYPVWEERSDYTVHIVNRDGSTVTELKNVKWTDEIWKRLTPTPTRENGELLKRLLLGTSIVYGGDTYGKFATGGEDSLTFIAVWDGAFASRSTISVGDSQWTGYRADASEQFFRDDQTVTLTVSHPEELLYFQYAVSDQLFENGSVAARKLSFVDYTGTFSTASLNLEEGKPYVIYGFLFTEFKSEIVINTDKIIIDKTAPAISGAKNGDVFCGEGDKTLTVTDLYLDTVTVNGNAVTPNEQGQITLTDARTPQTVVATDKAGNSTTLTVTVHSSHSYQWQTENGQYWGECEFCGSKTERKAIPELTITSPDTVCRTQDFTFSFRLPEGCTDSSYSYEFKYTGDGEPITPVDGLCTGTIPANDYKDESSFRFVASVSTAEGYRVSVDKAITIQEQHAGGTATCTQQAVCDTCNQPYGDPLGHNFGAWTSDGDGTHSRACTAENCPDANKGKQTETHIYDSDADTICNKCGYERTVTPPAHEHTYGDWTADGETRHSRVCTAENCPDANKGKQTAAHVYDDDADADCNVCGYERTVTPPAPAEFIVTFDGNGGTPSVGSMTTTDQKLPSLPSASRSGSYSFDGWYTEKSGGTKITTDTVFSAKTTVYAHWTYNGSSGYSYYTINATAGTGGSISPSGSVSVREGRDQTFTITPDKGYAVANVKIDGKSIGAVKSYTFENVRRTHIIEVIFMKANGNSQTGVFVDVATSSYYEDAVDWAVENGITKGTDDTHFSPNGICTRAQAVTFLWRAAGSPAPKTGKMPFTDVPEGSYYYDAVLWAVENGITFGTSETTFSPNMACSRAQIVTLLWRSEKSPAAGSNNPFTDVSADTYYYDAVLWAAENEITKGTTNTTFSPDKDCTRAQIVTFLWRCKK